MAANTENANIHSEYSHWLNVHGQLSDREHSEIKSKVMFSTSTVFIEFYSVSHVIAAITF